jgi:diguanylate cyclase (GGDEF)-like protein/PAS domain S-box-containing protein
MASPGRQRGYVARMGLRSSMRALSYFALAISLIIFVAPPTLYMVSQYRYEKATILTEAEINARIVGELINKAPDLWAFQVDKLETLLARRSNFGNYNETRRIWGLDGKNIAQSQSDLPQPWITESALLLDSGKPVGTLEVTRSLRLAIQHAVGIGIGSLLAAMLVFFAVRNIPLRALKEAFDDLHEAKEKALITLQSIGDAVITTDPQMRIEYLNPIAEHLTGWRTAQAQGLPMDEVFKIYKDGTRVPALNPIKECLETKQIVEMENHTILVRRSDGEEFHIEDSAAPIFRKDGSVIGAVMVFHDVTERKDAQQRLQHTAFHDALTGLPNRDLFRKRLRRAIAELRTGEAPVSTFGSLMPITPSHTRPVPLDGGGAGQVAVLFMDLDRFKSINDSLGHSVGDELLILVAKRLKQCVRETDTVCRMGGDEFTAVLTGIHETQDASAIAHKMRESLAQPFNIQKQQLRISSSIGIALYPQDGEDLEDLLKNADTAMYQAKEAGRNNVQFYAPAMNAQATEKLKMEYALHTALDNDEYLLVYQPKLDLRKNKVVGVEALLRWNSRELGMVMPTDFIPRLEESGGIVQVGRWVLKTAIYQAKRWLDAGSPMLMSVNVSAYQLRQTGLVEDIADLLRVVGLPPPLLQIEMTESLLMDDVNRSEFIIHELIGIGVKIALDDFGTGYSSLSYLRRFPINELKIDRSFVTDIDHNSTAARIVKTVVDLGQALGMKVTAEGVENERQLELLTKMGCDEMQGYLLSRPLGIDALQAWLDRRATALAV